MNNHRAQARAADEESPWVAPDLSVSALVVDPVGCPVQAVLSVRIGNGGANLAPPATVAFYAGDPRWGAPLLGLAATGAALAPGQGETVELVVEGPPEGAMTVCVAVDGEAAV
ncbi:MAG: hypothetical protein GY856_31930, partial [bacterium]|nr:hypothetical protein [bacterium]